MNNSKTVQKRKNFSKKPQIQHREPLKIIPTTMTISGTKYYGNHTFSCGHSVPIYEVFSVHALNQIIGYAKFINRSYGDVYYRGEAKLHPTLRPSVLRSIPNIPDISKLKELISIISKDERMKHQLKFNSEDEVSTSNIIEGMLQHYGVKTRYIDIVDNHWIALWMGLNTVSTNKQIQTYSRYIEREIPLVDFINGETCKEENLFQYILLMAIPGHNKRINNGIFFSNDFTRIDLRQALPSTFLRPHAQHGLVVCKRPHTGSAAEGYDLADTIIGILKIRIDRVKEWIGEGKLLTQDNLFPPPSYDQGYDILLSRSDIFDDNGFFITRYI